MPDSLRRAIRTFLQAFVGTLSLLAIPVLTDLVRTISSAEPYEIDFRFWQSVLIASCAAGAIALITWLQNFLEDKGAVPSVLKSQDSVTVDPVE